MKRELNLQELQSKASYITTFLNYMVVVTNSEENFFIEKKDTDGWVTVVWRGTANECEAYLDGLFLFANPEKSKVYTELEIETTKNGITLKDLRVKATELSTYFNFLLKIKRIENKPNCFMMVKADDLNDIEELIFEGTLDECEAYLDGITKDVLSKFHKMYASFIRD